MRCSNRACWVVCALLAAACARTHPVPPYPPPVSTERDAAADANTDEDRSEDGALPSPRGLARNIIVFLGDGMGAEQLAAGRFVHAPLRLDALAGPALSTTDSLTTTRIGGDDPPATDSAAAATTFATGTAVENGVLSETADGEAVETVLEACKRAGKATGLITTSYFFDASPAAFAAHQPSRGLDHEIVKEMLTVTRPDVVMGAGEWVISGPANALQPMIEDAGYTILRGKNELAAWDPLIQPRILALFATDFVPVARAAELYTMTPELVRTANSPDPSLATMTQRAIERLSQDPDGFFLFAEDEIFDQMGHRGPAEVAWANEAYPAQVVGFDAAVGVAIDWVIANSSFEETLIVVFSDHETGGYRFDHAVGPSTGEFTAVTDRGAFLYGFHTRTPIEVYARGPGSDAIDNVHNHADTHRLMLGRLP